MEQGRGTASDADRERSRSPARRSNTSDPPFAGKLFEPDKFKYIDKTFLLARLLTEAGRHGTSPYLFAPAPRRVGKTTTVAMLEAMARGEKDKFEGMAVTGEDSPFKIGEQKFQVVRLNFSGIVEKGMNLDAVREEIHAKLVDQACEQHDIKIQDTRGIPSVAMRKWLTQLKQRHQPLVVLIDEYDAPMNAFLPSNPDLAEDVAQRVFKQFYEVLKEADVYKLFITGVANFAGTSVFSGFNSIVNIMQEDVHFATLFGFTEREIRNTYAEYIQVTFGAQAVDKVLKDLKEWYNGYRAHPKQLDEHKVYNPWSVLKYFQFETLQGHWVQASMQTSLVELLGLYGVGILNGYTMDATDLFANIAVKEYLQNWKQVAFHCGYATILNYVDEVLELGVPNREVREWLEKVMAKYLIDTMTQSTLQAYAQALERLDFQDASRQLQAMIRSPKQSPPRNEADFTMFVVAPLLLAKPLQIGIDVEIFSQARQELVDERRANAKVPDVIFWFRSAADSPVIVMELKFKRLVAEAIAQIKDKQYIDRAQALIEDLAKKRGFSPPPRTSFYGLAVTLEMNSDGAVVQMQCAD